LNFLSFYFVFYKAKKDDPQEGGVRGEQKILESLVPVRITNRD
jgi:hypothetical protein